MSRHYSSDHYTMYMNLGFHADDTTCTVDKCDFGSRYSALVMVRNDLFDDLADKDTVALGLGMLADAAEYDPDTFEVGYIEEEGWYEPPTFCWSDPSCSDPGDGDTTSAKVTVDMNEEGVVEYINSLIEALDESDAEWDSAEQEAAVKAFYEKLKPRLAEEIMKALDSVDGDDLI